MPDRGQPTWTLEAYVRFPDDHVPAALEETEDEDEKARGPASDLAAAVMDICKNGSSISWTGGAVGWLHFEILAATRWEALARANVVVAEACDITELDPMFVTLSAAESLEVLHALRDEQAQLQVAE